MKKHRYNILIAALLFLFAQLSLGQVATSLYFMDNIPQSHVLNPAFIPNYNIYIGMPALNSVNTSFSSDIGLSDVYDNKAFFWNSAAAYERFVSNLPKNAYLSTEFNMSLLSFGFNVKKIGYFHFAWNHRTDVRLGIPRDLAKMNDLTINHDLAALEMQERWYNEYALGYSRIINEQLTVGANLKYLAGVAGASLRFDRFDFNTSSNEAWEVRIRGRANVAGPVEILLDENNYPEDAEETIDMNNVGEVINYSLAAFSNPGFGLDLGAEYKILPRLKLSGSLIDIGVIRWKRDLTNLNIDADYRFKGVDDLIITDEEGKITTNEDAFDALQDTLKHVVKAEKTHDKFTNTLSPKLFIGAEYELLPSISFGFLSKTHFIGKGVRQNFLISANANLRHALTFGVNYNLGVNSQNSFGGVLGLGQAPVHFYIAADFIPGYAKGGTKFVSGNDETEIPITLPKKFSSAGIQFGFNVILKDRRKKEMEE